MGRPLKILLLFLCFFLSGLLFGQYVPIGKVHLIALSALAVLLVYRPTFYIGVAGLWFAGGLLSGQQAELHSTRDVSRAIVKVEEAWSSPYRAKYLTQLQSWEKNKWLGREGRLLLTCDSDSLESGEYLLIEGALHVLAPARTPRSEGFNKYLESLGVRYTADAKRVTVLTETSTPVAAYLDHWRREIRRAVDELDLDQDKRGIVLALLIGDKSRLSPAIKKYFAQSGTSHVLAVSGLHVGVVFAFLWWFTRPLKRQVWVRMILLILGLFLFTAMASFRPSVLRASVMAVLAAWGLTKGVNQTFLIVVVSSALLFLLVNPSIINQIGFVLSYSAVVGIVIISPRITDILSQKKSLPILRRVVQFLAVSMSAQLCTAPFVISSFGSFSSYFLVGNALLLPLVPVVMMLGGVATLMRQVPYVGSSLMWLLDHLLQLIIAGVSSISSWPMASLDLGSEWVLISGVIAMVALILSLRMSWKPKFLFGTTAVMLMIVFFPIDEDGLTVWTSKDGIVIDGLQRDTLPIDNYIGAEESIHGGKWSVLILSKPLSAYPDDPCDLLYLGRSLRQGQEEDLLLWADSLAVPIWRESEHGMLQIGQR